MAKRLDSAVPVRNVKTPGRSPAGDTLYLMVWPSARKSWVQRLTIEGKRKDVGLGPYPTVSLARARKRAQDNLSLAKSGGNPLAAKQEEAKLSAVPTFEALARQHIAENLGSWRSAKHGAQWSSTLAAYAFPTFGALQVNEITRRHVVDALPPSGPPSRRPHGAVLAEQHDEWQVARRYLAAPVLDVQPADPSRTGCCCPQAQPDLIARMTLVHHLTGRDPLLSAPSCE